LKMEILRLQPQNDIMTQSLEGEEIFLSGTTCNDSFA